MQRVTLVRYRCKPEAADENEALSRAVFEEARATTPAHVAYGLFRDGDDFLHLFINTAEDDSAAITELPTFKAFSQGIADRCVTPPDATRMGLTLVESYGLPK